MPDGLFVSRKFFRIIREHLAATVMSVTDATRSVVIDGHDVFSYRRCAPVVCVGVRTDSFV